MNEIVGPGLEDLWVVEAVVQVVAAQIEILWLVRDKQGIDINRSNLTRSAIVITTSLRDTPHSPHILLRTEPTSRHHRTHNPIFYAVL